MGTVNSEIKGQHVGEVWLRSEKKKQSCEDSATERKRARDKKKKSFSNNEKEYYQNIVRHIIEQNGERGLN